MIKKRDKDGNIVLGIPTAPAPNEPLPPVEAVSETRYYDFHVEGLPLNATNTDAINAAIRDLTAQGLVELNKISNGVHTFEELYKIIQELQAELKPLEQYKTGAWQRDLRAENY